MQDSNVTNPSGFAENEHASGLASTHFSVPWIPLALMTFAGLIDRLQRSGNGSRSGFKRSR
jgi:hypothetical protein